MKVITDLMESIFGAGSMSGTTLLVVGGLTMALFMALVSLFMPLLNADISQLWFSLPNFFYLAPMPVVSASFFWLLWRDLHGGNEWRPFVLSIGIFLMNYIGLAVSTYPWLVPFTFDFRQAAAAPESLSLLLVGTALFLPLVLFYTGYVYYVYRGKSSHEASY